MSDVTRILIFAPAPAALAWTEAELVDQSLGIREIRVEVVLRRPLSRGGLRDAVVEIGLDRSTVVAP